MRGIVDWFNQEEGYGFIKSEENRNVLVIWKNIITDKFPTLIAGDIVDFKQYYENNTLKALNVVKIEK